MHHTGGYSLKFIYRPAPDIAVIDQASSPRLFIIIAHCEALMYSESLYLIENTRCPNFLFGLQPVCVARYFAIVIFF